MSKSNSHQFTGTKGQKIHEGLKVSNQRAKVIEWAEDVARHLSPTQRSKFNTATVVFDESTGKLYFGRNKGIAINNSKKNPIIFGDDTHDGLLPPKSLNKYAPGNCSEVDGINNALNDGAKLGNLHIYTIHTTKRNMGNEKIACENCTYAFKHHIKRNNTGWKY